MNNQNTRLSLQWVIISTTALFVALLSYVSGSDILTFSFTYATIAFFPLCVIVQNNKIDFFQPYFGLITINYFYSVSTLLFAQEYDETYYGEFIYLSDLNTYKIACLLTAAGLSVGFYFARYFNSKNPRIGFDQGHRSLLLKCAVIFGILFAPFIILKFMPWMATNYSEVALSIRVDRMQDQSAGLKEILTETIPITIILCALTRLIFDVQYSKSTRFISGTFLVAYIATSLLSGWRGQMIISILIIVIYYHYRIKKLQPINVIPLSAGTYLVINGLSVARISSNPIEMVMTVFNDIGNRGFAFLALQQSGELATSTNLLRLIQGIRTGETNFGFGEVAISQLGAFIPRVIWEDRPNIASELFVKTFYPGIFESGGGYGFFFPQDGYWDFGLAGAFLYAAIFSIFLQIGFEWIRKRFKSDLYLFAYALIYSQLVLAIVRSGIFASLKASLIATSPLLLLFIFVWITHRMRLISK